MGGYLCPRGFDRGLFPRCGFAALYCGKSASYRHHLHQKQPDQIAKELGLSAIQRLFIIDSLSMRTAAKTTGLLSPEALEIMPGIMPKILRELSSELETPLIAGGLITQKEDVISALNAGALGVSTTNPTCGRSERKPIHMNPMIEPSARLWARQQQKPRSCPPAPGAAFYASNFQAKHFPSRKLTTARAFISQYAWMQCSIRWRTRSARQLSIFFCL